MGGAVSAGEDNDELIDNLVEAEYIKSENIEAIFRAVDRGHYYLEQYKETAYRDLAWKQGNLHLSAPCIYSEVMESLQLKPGLSFLNLGSGTGYLNTMIGLVLGTYGINHGIELHADVVEYAEKKLSKFKGTSTALDRYEFSEPQFVIGNCLLLEATRQYDRVYCGASCPPENETYMKNLIKVNGILVMPLNDQLVQITRKSETSWQTKCVLPVSFASLMMPSSYERLNTIKLPESQPLFLQHLCRDVIRVCIRNRAENDIPDMRYRNTYKTRQSKSKNGNGNKSKKAVRRGPIPLMIPISEESDGGINSDDSSGSNRESDPSRTTSPARILRQRVVAAAASSISAVIKRVMSQDADLRQVMGLASNESMDNGNVTATVASSNGKSSEKNEKFEASNSNDNDADGDETDNNGRKSKKSEDEATMRRYMSSRSWNMELEEHDACDNETHDSMKKTLNDNSNEMEPLRETTKRSISITDDEEDADGNSCRRAQSLPRYIPTITKKRAAGLILKRMAMENLDSDSDSGSDAHKHPDGESTESDAERESKAKAAEEEKKRKEDVYTSNMAQRIMALPLPLTLKMYLNYNRDLN